MTGGGRLADYLSAKCARRPRDQNASAHRSSVVRNRWWALCAKTRLALGSRPRRHAHAAWSKNQSPPPQPRAPTGVMVQIGLRGRREGLLPRATIDSLNAGFPSTLLIVEHTVRGVHDRLPRANRIEEVGPRGARAR